MYTIVHIQGQDSPLRPPVLSDVLCCDDGGGVSVQYVSCEGDIFQLLAEGEANRRTASTNMNQHSSRSHSVFMMLVEQKCQDGSVKRGKLNLVDLAGSERLDKTGAEGDTKKEVALCFRSSSCRLPVVLSFVPMTVGTEE